MYKGALKENVCALQAFLFCTPCPLCIFATLTIIYLSESACGGVE